MKQVTHVVRHPFYQGDHYAVCDTHKAWAEARLRSSGEVVSKKVAPCDVTSGCVFVLGEAQLKRRMKADRIPPGRDGAKARTESASEDGREAASTVTPLRSLG